MSEQQVLAGLLAGAVLSPVLWFIARMGLRALVVFSVVFLLIFLTGCVGNPTPYAEIGAGYNGSFTNKVHPWEDGGAGPLGATIEAGVTWDARNNPNMEVDCRWLHVSHWFVGQPFNDKAESSLDHFGCSARYEWRN